MTDDNDAEENMTNIMQQLMEMNRLLRGFPKSITLIGQLLVGSVPVDISLLHESHPNSYYSLLQFPFSMKLVIRQLVDETRLTFSSANVTILLITEYLECILDDFGNAAEIITQDMVTKSESDKTELICTKIINIQKSMVACSCRAEEVALSFKKLKSLQENMNEIVMDKKTIIDQRSRALNQNIAHKNMENTATEEKRKALYKRQTELEQKAEKATNEYEEIIKKKPDFISMISNSTFNKLMGYLKAPFKSIKNRFVSFWGSNTEQLNEKALLIEFIFDWMKVIIENAIPTENMEQSRQMIKKAVEYMRAEIGTLQAKKLKEEEELCKEGIDTGNAILQYIVEQEKLQQQREKNYQNSKQPKELDNGPELETAHQNIIKQIHRLHLQSIKFAQIYYEKKTDKEFIQGTFDRSRGAIEYLSEKLSYMYKQEVDIRFGYLHALNEQIFTIGEEIRAQEEATMLANNTIGQSDLEMKKINHIGSIIVTDELMLTAKLLCDITAEWDVITDFFWKFLQFLNIKLKNNITNSTGALYDDAGSIHCNLTDVAHLLHSWINIMCGVYAAAKMTKTYTYISRKHFRPHLAILDKFIMLSRDANVRLSLKEQLSEIGTQKSVEMNADLQAFEHAFEDKLVNYFKTFKKVMEREQN